MSADDAPDTIAAGSDTRSVDPAPPPVDNSGEPTPGDSGPPARRHRLDAFWTLALVVALVLSVAVAIATRRDAPRSNDSEVYLSVSDSIWAGHGLTIAFTTYNDSYTPEKAMSFNGWVPLVHFPPGYSLAIATARLTGANGPDGVRLLAVLVTAANALLLAALWRRLAPKAPLYQLPVALAVVFMGTNGRALLSVSGWTASEPLFIAWSLAALVAVERAVATNARRMWILAGLLGGCALATRFAGVGLVAALVTVALVHRRVGRAVLVGALAFVPVLPFVIWTRVVDASSRSLVWHGDDRFGSEVLGVVKQWLTADSPNPGADLNEYLVAFLACAVIGGAVCLMARRRELPEMWLIAGVYLVMYVVGVFVSRSFFDATIPIAERLLLPAQVVFMLTLTAALLWLGRFVAGNLGAVVATIAVVIVLVAPGTDPNVDLVRGGWPAFDTPDPPALLDQIPDDQTVFTNNAALLHYASGRHVLTVPLIDDLVAARTNEHYDEDLRELGDLVCTNQAAVLFFGAPRFNQAPEADLVEKAGLEVVARDGNDVLFGCGTTAPAASGSET